MISEQPTTKYERTPYQLFIAELKKSIKADAVRIRSEKQTIRNLRLTRNLSASSQSWLAEFRREARARLLIYGLMRGRTWDQIEPKHEMYPVFRFAIKRVFKDAQSAIKDSTGVVVPMPEVVEAVLV